jgi:hypothetical protein
MWRLTKAIIISWLVGVICGVGIVIIYRKGQINRRPLQVPVKMPPKQTAPHPLLRTG